MTAPSDTVRRLCAMLCGPNHRALSLWIFLCFRFGFSFAFALALRYSPYRHSRNWLIISRLALNSVMRSIYAYKRLVTQRYSVSYLSYQKGGDPAALSSTATLLRLHPPYQPYLRRRAPFPVRQTTSGTSNSGGVTGGVYKAREHIHRAILMRDY